MTRELQDEGLQVGRRRTARLMRENGLKARQKRRFKRTTDSHHAFPIAPNLLDQDFSATRPNQKWNADISEILSANSESWRQRSKAGHACLGARPSVQPVYDPQDVHRSRRTHLLEAGLQEPDIPAPAHSEYPHTL